MVWAWTMPARHSEPDRDWVRDGGSAGCSMRSIRCRSPRVTPGAFFSSADLARLHGARSTDGPVTGSTHREVAHAWSAVVAKPIRPPMFAAVLVPRLPARHPGGARRTDRRIGR